MARNDGILLLLGLGILMVLRGKKGNGYTGGYPRGYHTAVIKTQRVYGQGSAAQIPAIQNEIEERNISTKTRKGWRSPGSVAAGIPYGSTPPSAVPGTKVPDIVAPLRTAKLDIAKARATVHGIPQVQELIEARRF